MSLSRRLLYSSEIWEVARPGTALSAGHLLIRLTNPAVAFDLHSATDWLLCHNIARQALAEVLGATRCTVVFAYQWHPIGAAIGEPEVESSTPTFHLFGRRDGETVTPGDQLLLPTQRRVPVPPEDLAEYDGGLRTVLRRLAAGRRAAAGRSTVARLQFAAMMPGGIAAKCHLDGLPLQSCPLTDAPLPAVVASRPNAGAGPHHTVLSPPDGAALTPGHLLAFAGAVQGLTERPGVSGLSCVVPDPGTGRLEIHAMGRSAGESTNPLQEFLSLPGVSQALL